MAEQLAMNYVRRMCSKGKPYYNQNEPSIILGYIIFGFSSGRLGCGVSCLRTRFHFLHFANVLH